MGDSKPAAWILAALTVATLTLQIARAGQPASPTETTLFGVLQFLFSIGFAWIMSRAQSRSEFEQQQRKFAISAYRRIREIERTVDRLRARVAQAIANDRSDARHELDVANSIATSICETAESSKLDWADVIGDQIAAIEEIESIKRKQLAIRQSDNLDDNTDTTAARMASIEQHMQNLRQSLDSSLQLLATQQINDESGGTFTELSDELEKHGSLTLKGFSDTRLATNRPVADLRIGEILIVSLRDVKGRTASLIAEDQRGNVIGSFLNMYSGSYADFAVGVCDVIGSSRFLGEVISRETEPRSTGRFHFDLKVKPQTDAPSSAPRSDTPPERPMLGS